MVPTRPLLTYFGRTDSPNHYLPFGYIVVMATGAVYVTCAALLLRNVNEKGRGKEDCAHSPGIEHGRR